MARSKSHLTIGRQVVALNLVLTSILLCEHRHWKVMEIAQEVGIVSSSTFMRQFKNYTGVTPEQYRKLNEKSSRMVQRER